MKIILSILLFCSILLADRDGGPYIGLGYGVSTLDSDELYKGYVENESEALVFYTGAYINKHLSVELSYVNFNIENDYKVLTDSGSEASLSFETYNVSTLAHYSFFDDILDFYAKFGVGNMSTDGLGSSGFTMLYGGGVGVRFSEMFSMKVAYDRYSLDYYQNVNKHRMKLDFIHSAFEMQF